ncbi:hypothetical protein PI126_g7180 [Phytophthora idaei]|nr:hypothetical protein PI126_g7180 [Phytophthora idaei]
MISVLEERCQPTAVADMKYFRALGIVTILPREADAAIVQWIKLFRKEGVLISSAMLRMKGAEIADDLGIAAFRGSWHWQEGFLRHHRLSIRARTHHGQVTPEKADEAAVRFGTEVQQKMLELRVRKVFSADQTGVFFFKYTKAYY